MFFVKVCIFVCHFDVSSQNPCQGEYLGGALLMW